MTIFLIWLAVILVAAGIWTGAVNLHTITSSISARRSEKKALPSKKDTKGLSEPAQRVANLYKELPEEIQIEDIVPMLKALDIKYGVTKVNQHFQVSPYGELAYEGHGQDSPNLFSDYKFSWEGTSYSCKHIRMCPYGEYRQLAIDINRVITAKEEQDKAMEVAGVQPDLDAIDLLSSRLREERNIINEVTKELT